MLGRAGTKGHATDRAVLAILGRDGYASTVRLAEELPGVDVRGVLADLERAGLASQDDDARAWGLTSAGIAALAQRDNRAGPLRRRRSSRR